jgi:hypothetical protein
MHMRTWRTLFGVAIAAAAATVTTGTAAGQPSAPPTPAGTPSTPIDQAPPCPATPPSSFVEGWPLRIRAGTDELSLYRPQLEHWDGDRLEARAALSVRRCGDARPEYGVAFLTARSTVDEQHRLVKLQPLAVDRVSFPSEPDSERRLRDALRESDIAGPRDLGPLDGVLAASRASPAVLVLIDGSPTFCRGPETGLLRVANTRALIAVEPTGEAYYLYVGDRWLTTQQLGTPWTVATTGPAGLVPLKEQAVRGGLVDLLDDANGPIRVALGRGLVPRVYVSVSPLKLSMGATNQGR